MTTTQHKSGMSETRPKINEPLSSGGGGRALLDLSENWFTATSAFQREMNDFVSRRLEKDNETFRAMTGCKNPVEVTSIQQHWMEETLRDYTSEMSKLMAIYANSNGRGGGRGK